MAAFDLAGYLARVGLEPPTVAQPTAETLAAVMLAQSRAIAFENVDVVLGKPISIEPADIEQQLVHSGRGGYCFQMNGLLALALEALGYKVVQLLCKVRWNKAPDEATTFTHVALRVTLPSGERFLADVGFAGTNSLAPLAMDTPEAQTLADGVFRVTAADGGWYMVSSAVNGVWRDLYTFRDEASSGIDLELSNWWSCTSPKARFTNQFFIARVVGNDKHHILDATYTVRKADGTSETSDILDKAKLVELLDSVFGLTLPAAVTEFEGFDRYLKQAATL